MAEYLLCDCLPDLKELENKTGRPIPASLLLWMKNSENSEDVWKPDGVKKENYNSVCDSFSEKINNLKQEMMWLRCADVRILRQLVAVHEGIEALRWMMMEERGAFPSTGSSLTGSLSNLATVEEQAASMSSCRKSPTFPQELICETTSDQPLPQHDCHRSNLQSFLEKESVMRLPHVARFEDRVCDQSPGKDLNKANVGTSPSQDLEVTPHKSRKDGANILRRALLRSSREKGSVNGDLCSAQAPSGETGQVHQSQKSFPRPRIKAKEEKESTLDHEKLLLGYDAQFCWVESQDDVTFL